MACVLVPGLFAQSGARGATRTRTNLQEVTEGLTCQCGCGLTVANCNHPSCGFAVPLRGELEGLINKGMTRIEILAAFRAKYGEKVLSAPTTEGFNILAWTMPFIALLAGAGLVVVTIGRWQRHEGGQKPTAAAPMGEIDDEAQLELRRQLKEEVGRGR